MTLFQTGDGVYLSYSNVAAAKQFWIDAFGCKEAKVPSFSDDPLPSDAVLILSGEDSQGIGLSDKAEEQRAGLMRTNQRSIIFCCNIRKAHEHLASRGVNRHRFRHLVE